MRQFLSRQQDGPFVYVTNKSHAPSVWTKFSRLEEQDRLKQLKRMVQGESQHEKTEWSWWKLYQRVFRNIIEDKTNKDKAPDSYNLYKESPDFSNDYGWSTALDESDYGPLKDTDTGIYLVNLTAVIKFSNTLHIYSS